MNIKDTHISEFDILSTLWFLWCNQKITVEDVSYFIRDLDLEYISLDRYRFVNKDRTATYFYDKQHRQNTE
jgi:hypothetical protein